PNSGYGLSASAPVVWSSSSSSSSSHSGSVSSQFPSSASSSRSHAGFSSVSISQPLAAPVWQPSMYDVYDPSTNKRLSYLALTFFEISNYDPSSMYRGLMKLDLHLASRFGPGYTWSQGGVVTEMTEIPMA